MTEQIGFYETAVTAEQRAAIEAQALVYETAECPCAGLASFRVYGVGDWTASLPPDAVAVDFTYRHEDDPEVMGLETTVFAADGVVVTSQDFG